MDGSKNSSTVQWAYKNMPISGRPATVDEGKKLDVMQPFTENPHL